MHTDRFSIPSHLGTSLLLLIFLLSFARVPLTYAHDSSSTRLNFAAVIFDGDSAGRHDLAGGLEKSPSPTPDGYFSDVLFNPIHPEVIVAPPCPVHVPFILPTRLVYTQVTSSAL